MAMKKKKTLGVVKFIHPKDSAIDVSIDEDTGKPRSDIEAYEDDYDFEKHCVLVDGEVPTYFKINFGVSYKKQIAIKNSTLGGYGKGEEAGFKLGNHSNQVVRTILIGIDNPEGMAKEDKISFKREDGDLVSKDTMQELEEMGVVDDLYSFWAKMKADPEDLKKS